MTPKLFATMIDVKMNSVKRRNALLTSILVLLILICAVKLHELFPLRDLFELRRPRSPIPPLPKTSISSMSSSPSRKNAAAVPVVLTLHFKTIWDSPLILHNCLTAQSLGVRMIVHTEYMTDKYCSVCTCVKFVPKNCPSPKPGTANHCEKLHWLRDALEDYREFIFLDADLIVMHPREFFYGMAARALTMDFLVTYNEALAAKTSEYLFGINSGMMFIRHIPTANYIDLVPMMYRIGTGMDQYILKLFIHKYYGMRWDTLSWKWHCRALKRWKNDINPAHCFTIHSRGEYKGLLKQLNRSLLTCDNCTSIIQ